MVDIWTNTMKEIKFAPGYFCDHNGNFITTRQNSVGKIMKVTKHYSGYLIIGFMINKKQKQFKTHRVVAITHLPNPNNYPVVDHIDRDKSNHKLSNLRWVDYSENGKNTTPKRLLKSVEYDEEEFKKEIWVKSNYFDGFGMEGIEISNLGRYRYFYKNKLKLITPKQKNEYTSIKSRAKNKIDKQKRIQLHKLVWVSFNGQYDSSKFVINHIDGNKGNNKLDNLELCTPSENITHAHTLGLVSTNKIYHGDLVENIFHDFYKNHIPVHKIFKKYNKGSNDVTKLLRGDHDYHDYNSEQKKLIKTYKETQSLIMSIQAKKSSVVKVRDIQLLQRMIHLKQSGLSVRSISKLLGKVGKSFVARYVKNDFEVLRHEQPQLFL